MLNITIIYAQPQKTFRQKIQIPDNITILDAIHKSKFLQKFPHITLKAVGIFGKKINNPENHLVKQGDRIEIYRPLIAKPRALKKT